MSVRNFDQILENSLSWNFKNYAPSRVGFRIYQIYTQELTYYKSVLYLVDYLAEFFIINQAKKLTT